MYDVVGLEAPHEWWSDIKKGLYLYILKKAQMSGILLLNCYFKQNVWTSQHGSFTTALTYQYYQLNVEDPVSGYISSWFLLTSKIWKHTYYQQWCLLFFYEITFIRLHIGICLMTLIESWERNRKQYFIWKHLVNMSLNFCRAIHIFI